MTGSATLRVARCLALDHLAADSIRRLADAGIPAILLKGPATVHWLYRDTPGRRNYTDIDLLVPPDAFDASGRVLTAAGWRDALAGIRSSEARRLYERGFYSPSGGKIDLHRGFYGVVDRPRFWRELEGACITIDVAGRRVRVPSATGAAVIYALHAAQNGGQPASSPKPTLDLRRAVERFDEPVWQAAAELAEQVGASDAFAIGLRLVAPDHVVLADVRAAQPRPQVVLRASRQLRRGDGWWADVIAADGLAERLETVRDKLVPSPAALRAADRNLVAAYARRFVALPVAGPRSLWRHWTIGRASRKPAEPRPGRRIPVARRRWLWHRVRDGVLHPDLTQLATVVWTARALYQTRKQLGLVSPLEISLPAPRGCGTAARRLDRAGAVRVLLRIMRATCLQECVVRQQWLSSAGRRQDIVVGVRDPGGRFAAHSWLECDRAPSAFVELTRYPAA